MEQAGALARAALQCMPHSQSVHTCCKKGAAKARLAPPAQGVFACARATSQLPNPDQPCPCA
eukprot:2616660-Alexandrium_andersonii.AAC.1